jgi:tetratricopeptide (TPR) repeat protein
MAVYDVREVATTLRMSSRAVYGLVRSGFVTPARDRRRRLQFSFQDILLLKTASRLIAASIPRRKVTRAVAALRRRLPAELPIAGLRISAVGDRIAVQSIGRTWDAETGQGMFAFDVLALDGGIRVIEPSEPATSEPDIDSLFAEALALEESDHVAAQGRYQSIIATDEQHVESYINCGRLLHLARDWQAAERLYRTGISACGPNAPLYFNLGVLLEDQDRFDEAIGAYQQALQCEPDHRDSHHNLARLFEASGRVQHAIRHFNHYRRVNK